MKRLMTTAGLLLFMMTGLLTPSCAGRGGGGEPAAIQPTKATVVVIASGALAPGAGIGGYGLTINLPDGVSVSTDAGGNVESSVAVPSGAAAGQAAIVAVYAAATSTVPAQLNVVMASTAAAGFTTGEFLTVNCTVVSGTPTEAGFTTTNFTAVDLYAAPLAGLTPGLTVNIQ